MNIPRELRNQILGHLLTTTQHIPVEVYEDPNIIRGPLNLYERLWKDTRDQVKKQAHVKPRLYPSILRVCQQLYAEGITLLYTAKHQILIWLPQVDLVGEPVIIGLRRWSIISSLHRFLATSNPRRLIFILKGISGSDHTTAWKFAFLLQPRESRLNTLTHITLRHYLSCVTEEFYIPKPANVMRFLMEYGGQALELLPQVETLVVEMHIPASCWYFTEYRDLTWYSNGYTRCPTQYNGLGLPTAGHVVPLQSRRMS